VPLKGARLVAACAVLLAVATDARGAGGSATWSSSPTDGNWVTSGSENNWSTGKDNYPGSTSGTTNTDIATFSSASSTTTSIVINSATLNIGGIVFSGSSQPTYTIGTTAGNSLFLSNGGQISNTATGGSATADVNAPLVLEPASSATPGAYTVNSNTTSSSHVLLIGGAVSGGTTTAGITLTLTGQSSGNAVNGNIVNGNASGGLAVSMTGSGSWALAGTNSYTGGTTITAGELDVTSDANAGGGGANVTINGGRFAFTASATSTLNIFLAANPTGSNSLSTFATSGSSTVLTYNGSFQNLSGSTGDLVKQGSGTLQLGGVSSYTGNTFLNNGITQLITGNNRLPTATAVSLGQAASKNTGELDLNGFNQQIAGLNSTNSTTSTPTTQNIVTTSTGTATLTLGGSGTYAYGDGSATNSGVITGALSLLKTGSGTQTIGDNNTYSGSTTINAGTLVAGTSTKGSAVQALDGTSGVSINSGGTLMMGAANQFNATTPAPVTLTGATGTANAATFAVNGNSQGSTTANGVGALTLTAASVNNVIDFGSKSATTTFAGLTTNGATLTINNYLNNSGTSGGPDELIFDQNETGNLGKIVFTGYGASSETALGSGFYEVFPSAVPEPATVLGGVLMVVALGYSQRRRIREGIWRRGPQGWFPTP
jgi:fibronectin-binding autotransporter adhesin